ncbi:MAG: hydrolase [Mucilaginibacter sp.]|nr:hydrolase [Mucilaginibacter sp.]
MERYEKIDADIFDLKIVYYWASAHRSKLFYVLCPDAKAFLKSIAKGDTLIEAAGGVVVNENHEYLFIYRNKKWDIPKGKIEAGEGIKEAALREVEEECGIKISSVGGRICKTYHVYVYKGEVVLKKTYWFEMRCKGQKKLKPQKEEGITAARWFKKDHIAPIVKNTYPSIMDVLVKEELVDEQAI